MPKKEHVHIVTDTEHKGILGMLGEKYGSMTKAFEYAIEQLNKLDNIGSCTDCEIKYEAEESKKLQEELNIISFSAENIREIIKYFRGESTITELLMVTRQKAAKYGKLFYEYLSEPLENTYSSLLMVLEEWKKRTRLLSTIQVNKYDKQIVCRVNVFERAPIFVFVGLIGYLQSLKITFDIELRQEEIVLKWLPSERYFPEKNRIEEKINETVYKASQELKPFILKRGFIPVMPHTIDWMAEKLLDQEFYPIEYSYRFITSLMKEGVMKEDSATQWGQFIKGTIEFLNYGTDFKVKANEEKKSFKISMVCVTDGVAKFLLQEAIIILAKYGWKLKSHKRDYKNLSMTFRYVGLNEKDILEPLYLINFGVFLNQRFQKLRTIPVDEYLDLAQYLYESDLPKFREVFIKQGKKYANAIKYLGHNDLKKMREVGLQVIPQLVRITQRDPSQISFVAEPNKFTLIFKTVNPVEMESMTAIFIGVMQGFGYLDISPKTIENMVTIEFKRPEPIDGELAKVEIKTEDMLE